MSHISCRRGYSLVELLVVLVIVGILAMVGVSMLGSRPSASVRTVMDELEGTISGAHKLAVATGRDVLLVSQGDWSASGTRMLLAYGDATLTSTVVRDNGLVASESFRLAVTAGNTGLRREHMYAGVVTDGNAAWWTTASAGSKAIGSVAPFDATPGFSGLLTTASSNLFQGGGTLATARISGANKRFTTSFWIEVVSLRDGQPQPGGPLGVLVVLANGGQIYKYYNPGIIDGGNGQWRKI